MATEMGHIAYQSIRLAETSVLTPFISTGQAPAEGPVAE